MTSTIHRGIVRLFHPTHHLWLRASPASTAPGTTSSIRSLINKNASSFFSVEIGLTDRGLEEVGDLTGISRHIILPPSAPTMQNLVDRGDKLISLEWEGHSITSADELYHTVWDTFEGNTCVRAPVTGTVENVIGMGQDERISNVDDDTVLVRMSTTREHLQEAMELEGLCQEVDYLQILRSVKPGTFAE